MAFRKQITTAQGVQADYLKMTDLHIAEGNSWARFGLFMDREKSKQPNVQPFSTVDVRLPYHPRMNKEQAYQYVMATDGGPDTGAVMISSLDFSGAEAVLEQGQIQAQLMQDLQPDVDRQLQLKAAQAEARQAAKALQEAQQRLNEANETVIGTSAVPNVRQ